MLIPRLSVRRSSSSHCLSFEFEFDPRSIRVLPLLPCGRSDADLPDDRGELAYDGGGSGSGGGLRMRSSSGSDVGSPKRRSTFVLRRERMERLLEHRLRHLHSE